MSKGPIIDPSIKLIASKKICDFVLTLRDKKCMPENILKIYQFHSRDWSERDVTNEKVQDPIIYSSSEREILKSLNKEDTLENIEAAYKNLLKVDKPDDEEKCDDSAKPKKSKKKKRFELTINDIKWLNKILKEKRKIDENFKIYLHELVGDCKIVLPQNEIIDRNPELEERCKKLRAQQEAREYQQMTKNVDNIRKHLPEDTIAYQMKQINKQLVAILQFIFSVAAGFAFGFIGIELIVGDLDFGFRLLLGIMIALIIALAEIYFLAKKLNENFDDIEDKLKNTPSGPGKTKINSQQKQHAD